jgi:hypothetical protein
MDTATEIAHYDWPFIHHDVLYRMLEDWMPHDEDPRQILDPVTITTPAQFALLTNPVTFVWQPAEDATAYRLTVFAETNWTVLIDVVQPGTTYGPLVISTTDQRLWCTVRARGSAQLHWCYCATPARCFVVGSA